MNSLQRLFFALMVVVSQRVSSLVLLTPPASHYGFYDDVRTDLFDFYADFYQAATAVGERVLLVATKDPRRGIDNGAHQELRSRGIPAEDMLDFVLDDIWARDFMPTQLSSSLYARFSYQPAYLDEDSVFYINASAEDLIGYWELRSSDSSLTRYDNIIMDGGNIVFISTSSNENGTDTATESVAIVTERVLRDNPALAGRSGSGLGPAFTCCPWDPYGILDGDEYGQFSIEELAAGERALEEALEFDRVAIVPEEPEVVRLGHIDGIANFLAPGILALSNFSDTSTYQAYEQLLLEKLGGNITIVPLPYAVADETFTDGFESAKGIYVNFLRTNMAIYLPLFDIPEDAVALEIAQSYSDLPVVGVNASQVAIMGGSVRCLSQHLWGDIAEAVLG
ncbi:Putative agmatine deiminase 2 [Seminavis robusta]|uniref:Agmatine deiminase 2 n=1 Tax=Seminavis robusta TaxID=568900 RepID=A0A9N8HQ09_9STRA|nr:Putative agmatine deiminase 2 [Seminavis robusta]|eukprot:Sro1124_g243760.1 Putative agmatine deiminase 2 (395) ;mRNA; r:6682-7866